MNVYDFDKTIYDGDSSVDFLFYVYKKHPVLWRFAFIQLFAALKYKLKITDKTTMKTTIYTYFTGLKDIDAQVDAFWKEHEHKVKDWYMKQRKDDDVIISASPEFLLKPVCDRLNVQLIASIVDKHSGKTYVRIVTAIKSLFDSKSYTLYQTSMNFTQIRIRMIQWQNWRKKFLCYR
jgi:phosphatidylglycerophosphatase C